MKTHELKKFLNKKVKIFLGSSHIFDGLLVAVRTDTCDLTRSRPRLGNQNIVILNEAIASIVEEWDE